MEFHLWTFLRLRASKYASLYEWRCSTWLANNCLEWKVLISPPSLKHAVQVSFQRDQSGKVFQLTIHQNEEDKIAPKVEPFSLNPDQLAEFTSDYYSEELGTTYAIVVKDSGLVVQHRRHADFRLTPQSKDKFNCDVWFFSRIQFERNKENLIVGFRVSNR